MKETVPPQYDRALVFAEGMAAVCKDGKWGLIDQAGRGITAIVYDSVGAFYDGLAKVCNDACTRAHIMTFLYRDLA